MAEQAKIANLQEKIREARATSREGNILFVIGVIIVLIYIGLHEWKIDHYLGNVYIGSEYPYRFANDWMLLALGLVVTALGSVQIFRGNYAKTGYMSQLERMATAIKCPNCGKEILQKTPYCPFCGHELQTQA